MISKRQRLLSGRLIPTCLSLHQWQSGRCTLLGELCDGVGRASSSRTLDFVPREVGLKSVDMSPDLRSHVGATVLGAGVASGR